MKTFVISIPKAGTYLVREILEQAGLKKSQLHISESGTYDYSKISYKEGRRKPNKCKTRMPLAQSLKQIPNGSFAVGHLAHSPETIKLLKDFNVLFIGRSIKEVFLSFMVYQIETGRALRDPIDKKWARTKNFENFIDTRGDKLMTKYITKILPWRNESNILVFDYNLLKKDRYNQTKRILDTIGEFTNDQAKQIADNSFEKPTQTLSKDRDRSKYWSVAAHNKIDELIRKYKVRYDL